jgi:hypothetical protein
MWDEIEKLPDGPGVPERGAGHRHGGNLNMKKPEQQTKKKPGQIAGLNWGTWVFYTLLYALGIAIVIGLTTEYAPVTAHLGPIPVDTQTFIWLIAIGFWGVMTAKMFKKEYSE